MINNKIGATNKTHQNILPIKISWEINIINQINKSIKQYKLV